MNLRVPVDLVFTSSCLILTSNEKIETVSDTYDSCMHATARRNVDNGSKRINPEITSSLFSFSFSGGEIDLLARRLSKFSFSGGLSFKLPSRF